MLTVTDNACEYLAKMLDEQEVPDGVAARCVVQSGQLTLVPDSAQPGDVVFKHEQRPVLIVNEELSEALKDREFDIEKSDEGEEQLTLK
jgi:Fe-S cluster assembly iron-binding protein IscA